MDDELYEAFNKASGHPWLDCTGAYVAEAQTPEAQWKQDQREHSEGSVLSPSDQERITEHADAALSAAPADLSSRETRGGGQRPLARPFLQMQPNPPTGTKKKCVTEFGYALFFRAGLSSTVLE